MVAEIVDLEVEIVDLETKILDLKVEITDLVSEIVDLKVGVEFHEEDDDGIGRRRWRSRFRQ